MFSRKSQIKSGKTLPTEWIQNIEKILAETYKKELTPFNKKIFIAGFSYSDEVWIAFSLISSKEELDTLPVSYVVSADLKEGTLPDKLIDSIVDSSGVFFDSYFNSKDWSEYQSQWTEIAVKNQKIFYTVTRENIEISIKTEQLLNQ